MAFNLFNRKQKRDQAVTPMVVQPQQPVQQPQFAAPADGNYIGLVNDMLGPTPAEREAQERRLAENKAKMSGWLGLFQGLGALGDLYYANKGVNPSQPNYQPQQLLNQHYAEEQQRLDNLYKNRQAYATMLYNMKRQAGEDARKDMLTNAQAKYYDTRDEMARMKAENDRLKTEKYIELQDGRIAKINAETGQITELLPYKKNEIQSRINKNNVTAANAAAGTVTEVTKPDGSVTTTVKTPARGKKKGKPVNKSNSGKVVQTKHRI